mmetsp:Transcript_7632/g.8757  ORF Transcript_7632/g.8757 Transcript_7632/m.8757 type:complete len:424 (-) Transcript_7632:1046-2317(-)|eukprot:CAMPEP_0184022016 /NCGR_PEP_ID=MMETSP0954-20121128/10313_1 /TAXON_ID=627963 /ORGANISM="Aplanochytrium sp, Strain PBS07" /LENGTH=423 /DNA_ID=CAMNT_0026304227 /DNA_START=147 /DNA_END=1418 /DNA_ORIENTATION=-
MSISCATLGDVTDGVFSDDDTAELYCDNSTVIDACFSECQVLYCEELGRDPTWQEIALEATVKILTFFLVSGFASSVEYKYFIHNFKSKSVYVGIACQFVMMPLIGFTSVVIFQDYLPPLYAVLLILVTACPGGAYSNWFCSVFNADLALSIAMTSASSILASVFLPLNIFIYVSGAYANLNSNSPDDIVKLLPYDVLLTTLAIVIAAVLCGLYLGNKFPKKRPHFNLVGNVAGVLIQAVGLFASSTSCSPPWEQPGQVIAAALFPLVCGLIMAMVVAAFLGLPKPQQVAIAIETAYQNIGIAVAIALSLGSRGREAAVVPVLYGFFEAVVYFPYCFFALFYGWTLSPKPKIPFIYEKHEGEWLWKVLVYDYQHLIESHPHYDGFRVSFSDDYVASQHEDAKVTPEDKDESYATTDDSELAKD